MKDSYRIKSLYGSAGRGYGGGGRICQISIVCPFETHKMQEINCSS